MGSLEWNEVRGYDSKIMWDMQDFDLPELNQEVLIFFPDTDGYCRKIPSDKYGRVIVGYFYLKEYDKISITDGVFDFGYIRDGIKWAEYNRPSQPNKQVEMCGNFLCKKYGIGTDCKCNEIPCEKCDDGKCVNCKLHLSQSIKCKNCKIW